MNKTQLFISIALISGLMHIIHEIYQFVRAVVSGTFAITIYYNRHGEAWVDAIAFIVFFMIAVVGLILYIKELYKNRESTHF